MSMSARFSFVFAVLPLLWGCGAFPSLPASQHVQFLPCIGHTSGANGDWTISVRGLVFERSWLNSLEPEVLEFMDVDRLIPDPAQRAVFEERVGLLLDNHPRGVVTTLLGGDSAFVLAKSDVDGHIRDEIVISRQQLEAMGVQPSNAATWVTLRVYTRPGDHREFVCRALLLPERGLSVISDIDDTVRVTDVNNTKLAIRHTLVDPFNAVPGMPAVYAHWASQGASFHYLSEGPKALLSTVAELISRNKYPEGTFHLRPVKWGRSHFKALLSMGDAPPEFKIDGCAEIMAALPLRRFVLIGDSGQHDPEVYGEVARQHPGRVCRILIRDVTCQDANDPRYKEAFRDLPRDLWQVFGQPAEIKDSIPAAEP